MFYKVFGDGKLLCSVDIASAGLIVRGLKEHRKMIFYILWERPIAC